MSALPKFKCKCGFSAWTIKKETKCSECGQEVEVIEPEPIRKQKEEVIEIIEVTKFGYKKTLRAL